MVKIDFILQGESDVKDHLSQIEQLFELREIEGVLISVGYCRLYGVKLIKKFLQKYKKKAKVILGIRNGITSIQALKELKMLDVEIIIVDTASTDIIFHPKVYLSYSKTEAKIIIGSANLTFGGLVRNIEASSILLLDLNTIMDKNYLEEILLAFEKLETNHPRNVYRIKTLDQLENLHKEGRLVDENVHLLPKVIGNSLKNNAKEIRKIKLKTRYHIIGEQQKEKETGKKTSTKIVSKETESSLIWISKPLTERDLNIPSGSNTHATGSILLKKGKTLNIDHRSYFRESVFKDLNWQLDRRSKKAHIERASTTFRIIIKGILRGTYELQISHNTKKNTISYQQKNAMTQLHWGDAKSVIAQSHLLGCTLRLYAPVFNLDYFTISIE
ncbi:MAG: hypothetical protein SCALA702_29840 [Melioribacteraceae bacterium]|nr:MAG: hypothetical protein SCALA702_29840 [Melioribacteraceae bacterium]